MKNISLIIVLMLPTAALSFETFGWEGEGIPVMSFVKPLAVFCETSQEDSSCVEKPVSEGIKMSFDNGKYISGSKVITVKAVKMIATADFVFSDYKLKIKKGTELTKYQYAAEGYYEVGIGNKVYQMPLYSYSKYLTNSDIEPKIERWVNVVGKGWLKYPNGSVAFHQREF